MPEDTYTVERSIPVAAPPERLYELVADFHRWPEWSPWEDIDPAMQRSYVGAESGVGAAYAWSGNRKAGQGRMEIIQVVEPALVAIDLAFEKPWKARNDTAFAITPEGSGSRVTWTMTGRKTFMTRVMGIFRSMDALLGPDFEKGLARLRTAAERSPGPRG